MKIGLDPHFAFANMLCDVGWARNYGTGSFFMSDLKNGPETPLAQRVEKLMPGLPAHVLAMMDQVPSGSCGRCSAFKPVGNHCGMPDLIVSPKGPGCPIFDAAPK
jgi:hypothetical protein